jgi:hypothetical protein
MLAQRVPAPIGHLEEVEDQEIGTRHPQCDLAKDNWLKNLTVQNSGI